MIKPEQPSFKKPDACFVLKPQVRTLLLSLAVIGSGWHTNVLAGCSMVSNQAANITITNTSSTALDVFWVDEGCVERLMTTLQPGKSQTGASFKSHVWRTRKATDKTLMTETQIVTNPATVTVKDPAPITAATLQTQLVAADTLVLPAASISNAVSPPNTPFVDPMPIPVVLTPMNALNPSPTKGSNPNPVPSSRTVEAKLNGITVASATIGNFTEAARPAHQRWTQFGGASATAPGFTGDLYESVEMEVPWNFYPAVDGVPASKVWTFVEANTGAIGPVRIKAQYGRPVIHRVHNALPADNGGFGINQTSTHLHNGHTPSESDGGPTQFYDAGRFKDYHYPNVRAGFATDVPTSTFNGRTVLGDFKETMSFLWFHDHRFDFTAQNVYKGLVSFYTLFSNDILLDTDNETTGLRLPSGEFDVPMILIDRSFSPTTGLLTFDTTNIDGVLGDKYTVNGKIQPYMNVKKRKYRFRLLDGGPSRYYELFLSNGASFKQLSTNGNMLPTPITTPNIRLGVAERTDVIVDFTNITAGSKIYLQNRLEQKDGRGPTGKLIAPVNLVEFRIQPDTVTDNSQVPTALLPLPDKNVPVDQNRAFGFTTNNGAWTVNGEFFDPNTIKIFPRYNSKEKWTFGSGGGWGHPVHVHFEEGQILSREGNTNLVADDIGRKDVYRLGQGGMGEDNTGTLEAFYKFRDFLGDYPIHCHNVVHEDHAMMTRFEVVSSDPNAGESPLPSQSPVLCAGEEQACVVPTGKTALVAYGANDQYVTLPTWSGSKWCSSAAFGKDPAPGLTKACAYLEYGVNGALPLGALPCASDNGTCSVPAGKKAIVYYGAPNGAGGSTAISYRVKLPVSGDISCNVATFGDPAPGRTDKSCSYYVVGDVTPPVEPPPPPPTTQTTLSPILCAAENQPCAVPSGKTALVAYGAGSQYVLLPTWSSGTKWCSSAAFGKDPAPGVAKACAYVEYGANGALPTEAVVCANQNGTCNVPADKQAIVYYGAPNGAGGTLPVSYGAKFPVSGPISCSNTVFGDPAPTRTDKRCSYVLVGQPATPPPPPPPADKATAVVCAAENQACVVPTGKAVVVAYGANDQFVLERYWTGNKWCSAAAFGKDPIPGVAKGCAYIEYGTNGALPTGSVQCAQDQGTCFIPTGKQAIVYYGAPNGTGGTKPISYGLKYPVSGSIACSTANFGDPAPGLPKTCSYLTLP